MAGQDFFHGVRVVEVNEGTRYIRTINTGIIGMVATADDADEDTFPLNVPTLLTNVRNASGKAGDTGTLAQSLESIADQTSPVAIVVRVPEGQTEEETTSNVIGTVTENQQYTGMQALLVAQSILGYTPRILGAPGLDNQEVTTAMVTVAKALRAFVYAKCQGETIAEMITYRNNFSARELMLIAPDFLGWDTTSNATLQRYATAYALGLRAKTDNSIGWHKVISNIGVDGVTGIDKDISWNLQSGTTDAALLNENDITTLINFNGFRFWGSRTCSDDSLFAFESATRTGQIIADTIAQNMFTFVDGVMSANNARDIIESVNAKLRQWTTEGYILGGQCWYDGSANPETSLKAGKIAFDYDYTPCPPMEGITFRQRITDRYFADFNQAIAQG